MKPLQQQKTIKLKSDYIMNKSLTENNYIYIPNFISEAAAKVMASNFKSHCKQNEVQGDNQAPNSSAEYNFIDFLEMLCDKVPTVSTIIGETVLPTYSYARVYKDGSVLERHRDRDACEISLTVHLDGDEDWPIYIETPDGNEVELILKPGDAMLYLGCVADHWRNQFLGKEYVQVFLHYVRSRGDKAYTYFDKKKDSPIKKEESVKQEKTTPVKINSKNKISDFIQIYEDIIPYSLCDEIINEYRNDDNWCLAGVGYEEINLNARNVNTIPISHENTILKNPEIRKLLDDRLYKVANEVIRKYNDIFPLSQIEEDSGYDLLKYEVGQFYRQHTDSYKKHPRAVSCSFALNDDFEGGEFAFFDRELIYNLKKGSVIMFPSNFMYPHEIMPVIKGTRYSIITWFV
jgi:Rps23 Pro-64 3,4-dihydroxylase Tpa1-like proline 4-hydroxylase